MRLYEVAFNVDVTEPIDAVSSCPLPESLTVLRTRKRDNKFTKGEQWDILVLAEETSQ